MLVTCAADLRLDSRAFGGDLLAIGGAVCLAGYLLIGRSVRTDLGVAGYSAIVYAVVCVIAAATAVAGGVAHLPSPRVALACAALALVCTIGGHTVYNWALRHVPVLLVSVSFLGEPPLAAMLALAYLRRRPDDCHRSWAACSSSPDSPSHSSSPARARARPRAHRDRPVTDVDRVRPSVIGSGAAVRRERSGDR